MYKGVFWLIDGELYSFSFDGSITEGIAKSGDTYNHKKLWKHVRSKRTSRPYDYYPRGCVDISNKGQPVVYMSPHIDEIFIESIKRDFDISGGVIIRYDHSEHYKCYLDN